MRSSTVGDSDVMRRRRGMMTCIMHASTSWLFCQVLGTDRVLADYPIGEE